MKRDGIRTARAITARWQLPPEQGGEGCNRPLAEQQDFLRRMSPDAHGLDVRCHLAAEVSFVSRASVLWSNQRPGPFSKFSATRNR